ncbi:MAG: mercuric reductase [Pedobacter sp.]|nr:MAG: mercuric reductase [Pedobacter sp.]
MKHYDAIVIGAGQAGVPLAKKLAESGMQTAVIEKRIIGGTCINDGCTPTKAMIASAQAAHKARNSADLGVTTGKVKIDFKKIIARKDGIVKAFQESAQKGLEAAENLDIIMGTATFSAKKEITVLSDKGKTKVITAETIFINTGAKTALPDLKGLGDVDYLTSTTIMELKKVPEHLIVIGGNYIGLEFGQMFHRFGSKVTIIEKSPKIMPREDDDVSDELTEILTDEGLKIITDATIKECAKHKGKVKVSLKTKGKHRTITGSHLLIATGRVPQTELLNLGLAGVKTDDEGFITVNKKLETNVKGIYALGDVKGGAAFTHIAYNDYTIVSRNLIKDGNYSTSDRPVPYCMYTDPQLGRVGVTEAEAKEQGLDYLVAKIPMKYVARGIVIGETRGFMKAVVDKKTKKILGASILAPEGGEIMSVLEMAMAGGITYDEIRYFVFAHPSYAESLNNLFMGIHP